ncbi:MAG: alpha/beta fold hydrolase [Clostridia bacterium]|nr:alpha/beta fold hydrolase [Clostridia bacterium]
MRSDHVISIDGRNIPVLHNIKGSEKKIAIVSHGFLSSKESSTGTMIAELMQKNGCAALLYDFPAHGQSAYPDSLRVEKCIDDLEACEKFVRAMAPNAEVCYFGSSFGAYITLLYIAQRPHSGKKAVLRSAAVNMPQLWDKPTEEEEALIEKQGWYPYDEGFSEPIRIYREFIDSMNKNDVYQCYKEGMADIEMVHGICDDVVDISSARKFSQTYGVPLTEIADDGHRLSTQEGLQAVCDAVKRLFLS